MVMSALSKERAAAACRARTRHGLTNTPEHLAWRSMRSRCSDPKTKCYPNYGGRGITVCERWNIFENFYEDMGPRPTSKHTLDRLDNSKNYEPENCAWRLQIDQQNNRRNTFYVTFRGEQMALGHAIRLAGSLLAHSTIERRIRVNGWDVERAMFTPPIHQRDRNLKGRKTVA